MSAQFIFESRALACVLGIVAIALCGQQQSCMGDATSDQHGCASQVAPLSSIEKHAGATTCQGIAEDQGGADDTAMIQLHVAEMASGERRRTHGVATCNELRNSGSVFVTDVEIGSPFQKFAIVADTGSNALIVPSCKCVQKGYCKDNNLCFNSSLSSSYKPDIEHVGGVDFLRLATLTYGSGSIVVEEATDDVQVANVSAFMKKGVFLMEDRRRLRVDGTFEGILGLGLPGASHLGSYPLWAQAAGVSRYTLCFNDVTPGALVLNGASLQNPMTNIGQAHWGLDFQGMSVGNASAPLLFCDPATKGTDMDTACGAIPDSGTTLMVGPQKDILTLYRSICQNWPRCNRNSSSLDKALIFQDLLYHCGDWLTTTQGVNEMPPIFLHLAGQNGIPQNYSLSAWAYVIETTEEQFKRVTAQIFPNVIAEVAFPTGKTTKMCQATFSSQEMTTTKNGPVWILGTPLFYEYTVGFDIGSTPFQIAVMDKPCNSCNNSGTALLSSDSTVSVGRARANGVPRKVTGPQREPKLHMSAHI